VFPPALALYLGGEVLKGLRYVHERREKGHRLGLVHRDVSPHNVLVGFSGEVKLSDFGIAKSLAHSTRTKTGNIRGKLSYASPEQLNGEPVDHRTDQFAMGITLWEILAGRPLFDGNDEVEIVGKVMRCDIPPLALVSPERKVQPLVEAFVRKMLSARKEQRHATTSEALSALLALPGYSADGAALGELVRRLFHRPIAGTASLGIATATPSATPLSPAAPARRGPRREPARARPAFEVPASVHDDGVAPLPSEVETRTMARASAVPAPGRRSLHAAHAPGTTAPVRRRGRLAWAIGAAVAIVAGAVAIGIFVAGRGSEESPVAAAPEVEQVAAAPAPAVAASAAHAVPAAPPGGSPGEPASVRAVETRAGQGESPAPSRAASERPALAVPASPPSPALVTLPVIVRSPPAAAVLAVSAAARSAASAGAGAPAARAVLDPVAPVAPLSAAATAPVQPAATAGARGDGGAANGAPIVE
jgi:serine/threonine-protein kinase